MQKHIWLISFWYPPINWTATERALKFTRSFVNAGWKVTVFTADTKRFDAQHIDHSRESEIPGEDQCRVIRVPVWFAGISFGRRDHRMYGRLKRYILGRIITPIFGDSGWIWVVPLYRALRKELRRCGPPDYVLANGPPFLPFWAVHRVCRARIPYALDYRDLWSRNPHEGRSFGTGHRAVQLLEARVNRNARMLLTVSEGCATRLREHNRVVTLYNYPDKRYLNYVQHGDDRSRVQYDDQILNVVYAGTLYNYRNLDPIAQAIRNLEPARREGVRVHYYGLSERSARVSFDRYDVSRNLVLHGNVDKQTIIAAMQAANVLLSIVYNVDHTEDPAINGIMTTKIFDYLISGTPIINVAPETNELYKWLDAQAFDEVLNVSAGQTALIRDYLAGMLTEKKGARRRMAYPDSLLWEHQAAGVVDRITVQAEGGSVKDHHE